MTNNRREAPNREADEWDLCYVRALPLPRASLRDHTILMINSRRRSGGVANLNQRVNCLRKDFRKKWRGRKRKWFRASYEADRKFLNVIYFSAYFFPMISDFIPWCGDEKNS